MFADQKYHAGKQTPESSPSACHSMSSSFSSSSESTGSMLDTPASTPRAFSDAVKLEDRYLSASSFYTTDKFGTSGFCPVSMMTEEMVARFQDPPILFSEHNKLPDRTMIGYNNFADYSHIMEMNNCNNFHNETPSLDLSLCSSISGFEPESSPVITDFVVPSQTTFIDVFDHLQSPMRPVSSLHFDFQYRSPNSEYSDFQLRNSPASSMASSMACLMGSTYDTKSASTTPSRPSNLRRTTLDELPTSHALHGVQGQETPPKIITTSDRLVRRKIKREGQEFTLPGNIHIAKPAEQECMWSGCQKRFRRKEHLRRHEKTHTGSEHFQCQFCQRVFNRADNLKQHTLIHAKPMRKAARTKYYPEAQKVYDEMNRKPRKSGQLCTI